MTKTIGELQNALEVAESSLAWERRIPEVLLALGRDFLRAETAGQLYGLALAAARDRLNWDEGQAFIVEDSNGSVTAVPHGDACSSTAASEGSREANTMTSAPILDLVNRAAKTGETSWIPESLRSRDFRGKQKTHGPSTSVTIAMPIKVSGKVVGVLVFSSRRVVSQVESIQYFCDLLAEKIGVALALQDAIRRDRDQTIMLLNASKMSALGEVAAGLAHEVSNPISAIATLCQIVRRLAVADPIDGKRLLGQVERIEGSIKRVTSIISDLQGFSRDASRDAFVEVRIRDVINQTLTLCRARFMKDRIALHVDDISSDLEVECRPSQVSQVLLNLLGNAYDAAQGMPGAWVKVEALDRGESFEIAVSNSGAPIPPEIAERVMDAFFTTKPPGKGTGLGLSISSSIAKAHNGTLRLDPSSPTPRFVLVLPKRQPLSAVTHESAA
jgi:signal transduction histidine kinase